MSISDLAPIAMGETTASIDVQHDIPVAVQQESSVVALYPNTAAEVLLRLFTALGLPEAGVSRVLVRNIREAVRNGDLADQYITNAIDVLSLVAGKEREKQYYAFHDMRLDRIRTARALRQEEAARLEKQARDAWIRAAIAALGFIQASLLLCLLAIERNSRG